MDRSMLTRMFQPPFEAMDGSVVDEDGDVVCHVDISRVIWENKGYDKEDGDQEIARFLADKLNELIS